MSEHRTTSILQRVPMILAVTAASYGLPTQAQVQAHRSSTGITQAVPGATSAAAPNRPVGKTVALAN